MRGDDVLDIRHTAVTEFERVAVKDLVQRVVAREAVLYNIQKFVTDVSCYVAAIWWVKPNYIATSLALFFLLLWVVLELVIVLKESGYFSGLCTVGYFRVLCMA